MKLTVGEISKVLGISIETIRFYVNKGIIKPQQNKENKYWEYSSEDVLILSDILFYRDLDISLEDINRILAGANIAEIQEIIKKKKLNVERQLEKYNNVLKKLKIWQDSLKEEIELVGKYNIGNMPHEFRKEEYYNEKDHLAKYLKNNLCIKKEDWMYASFSFHCDISQKPPIINKYFSIYKTAETERNIEGDDIIEETAEKCLITQVLYESDTNKMIEPIISYAQKHNYELAGEIFMREYTNYFVEGERRALYRVFACIK